MLNRTCQLDGVRCLRLFLFVVCLFVVNPGYSADQASSSISQDEGVTFPLDQLDRRFRSLKDKGFSELKTVASHVENDRFSAALVALRRLKKQADLIDYVHFFSGQAQLGLSRDLIRQKSYKNAQVAAEKAREHFQFILESPQRSQALARRSAVSLGEAWVESGEALARQKRKVLYSINAFEEGFGRLASSGLLGLVPTRSIVTYAGLCESSTTEVCQNWVTKLAPLLDKTDEALVRKLVVQAAPGPSPTPTKRAPRTLTEDAKLVQEGIGHYLAGEYTDGYVAFREVVQDYPQSNFRLRARFWMARCAQKTQHELQSQTLFREIIREAPFSYYAMLASWFGNIDLSRMISTDVPLAQSRFSELAPKSLSHLERAERLIANDALELAKLELKEVYWDSKTPTPFLYYLAELHHRARNHRQVFQVYGELVTREPLGVFSLFGEKLVFPKTFSEIISNPAKEFKVNPLLALSIIKQESAFDAEASSVAAAYGLMQLIRPTARDLDPEVTLKQLLKPSHNVRLGIQYISQMLKRYNGSLIHALAAYNAGPQNSDRWKREIDSKLTPEEHIELIGFKETREYVQNILRNLYWYTRLTRGNVPRTIPEIEALAQGK